MQPLLFISTNKYWIAKYCSPDQMRTGIAFIKVNLRNIRDLQIKQNASVATYSQSAAGSKENHPDIVLLEFRYFLTKVPFGYTASAGIRVVKEMHKKILHIYSRSLYRRYVRWNSSTFINLGRWRNKLSNKTLLGQKFDMLTPHITPSSSHNEFLVCASRLSKHTVCESKTNIL